MATCEAQGQSGQIIPSEQHLRAPSCQSRIAEWAVTLLSHTTTVRGAHLTRTWKSEPFDDDISMINTTFVQMSCTYESYVVQKESVID